MVLKACYGKQFQFTESRHKLENSNLSIMPSVVIERKGSATEKVSDKVVRYFLVYEWDLLDTQHELTINRTTHKAVAWHHLILE